MSFLHPSAMPVVRSRRSKDGGNRNVVVGIARRREPSKHHEDKALTSSHQFAEDACIADETERKSTALATSSSEDAGKSVSDEISPVDISAPQPITPLALQQYLDMEPEAKISGPAVENASPPHHIFEQHAQRSVQKLKEKTKSNTTHIFSRKESNLSETPADWNFARTSGPAKETSPLDDRSKASATAPALLCKYEPSFPSSPADSPAPSHHINTHALDNFQDFGRFEVFEDRNHPPAFAPAQIQYLAKSGSPLFNPESHQMSPLYNPMQNRIEALDRHQQAFVPPNLVQNTYSSDPHKEDLIFLLHQVNTVLPSLKMLLEHTSAAPIEGTLREPGNSTPRSWQYDVSQEQDHYIKKLNKTIRHLRAQLENTSSVLQNKLDDAESSCSQLLADLEASKGREKNLRVDLEVLEREQEAMSSRCRQSETALESFIQWLLQQTEIVRAAEDSSTQTFRATERASEDNIEKGTESFKDSIPRSHRASGNGGLIVGDEILSVENLSQLSMTEEQAHPVASHATTMATENVTSNHSPWLANGWQIAATNARVKIWEEEYARLRGETEERRQCLIIRHEKEKHELEVSISASRARHEALCEQMQAESMILRRENELLKAQLASQRAGHVQSNLELKNCVFKLNKESQAMQRVLEGNWTAANTGAWA